jgi:protein-S-isoprenylcysteine O-methyltransferase Ste14
MRLRFASLLSVMSALGFLLKNSLPLAATAALWAVLHFGVVLREERHLEAKFGETYLVLKHSVGRWI